MSFSDDYLPANMVNPMGIRYREMEQYLFLFSIYISAVVLLADVQQRTVCRDWGGAAVSVAVKLSKNY